MLVFARDTDTLRGAANTALPGNRYNMAGGTRLGWASFGHSAVATARGAPLAIPAVAVRRRGGDVVAARSGGWRGGDGAGGRQPDVSTSLTAADPVAATSPDRRAGLCPPSRAPCPAWRRTFDSR
jgi:hypothetical protein